MNEKDTLNINDDGAFKRFLDKVIAHDGVKLEDLPPSVSSDTIIDEEEKMKVLGTAICTMVVCMELIQKYREYSPPELMAAVDKFMTTLDDWADKEVKQRNDS